MKHKNNIKRVSTTILIGIVIFAVAILIPKLLVTDPIPSLLTTQILELILALLAIGILGKWRFSEYGFRLPKSSGTSSAKPVQWLGISLVALSLGAIATLAIAFTHASGNPLVKQLSLPQIILFVWISSSIIEEIFTRGFIQGHISILNSSSIKFLFFRINIPTLISAAFFGAMHTVLLLSGADLLTTIIIVIFTFSLGLLAGHQRARSQSLIPAVFVHMLANMGGLYMLS